jgi:hypothetical protein
MEPSPVLVAIREDLARSRLQPRSSLRWTIRRWPGLHPLIAAAQERSSGSRPP